MSNLCLYLIRFGSPFAPDHFISLCQCFCFKKYVENVKQDASIGTNILRVSASDEDADNNGAIVYTLNAGSNAADLEYFEIQPESGWIVLKKPLDVSMHW